MRYFLLIIALLTSGKGFSGVYIEPTDPLFKLVAELRTEKSRIELRKLVDEGNVEAAYWYAASIGSKDIREHAKSYEYFKMAAEGGNPYAMLRISGEVGRADYDCDLIGWPCDSVWKEKAIDELKRMKDKGDVKAHYYYNKYSGSIVSLLNPFSDHMSENEFITYSASRNYYTPLIEYLSANRESPEKISDSIMNALELAVDQEFGPALYYRGDSFNQGLSFSESMGLLKKSAKKGYLPAYNSISYHSRKNNDYITAYTYLYVEFLITGKKHMYIDSSRPRLYKFSSLDSEHIEKAKEYAQKIYDGIEPEIYFDEGDFFSTTGMSKYR